MMIRYHAMPADLHGGISRHAQGDVVRWHHETFGTLVRLENRTNATEQAISVATNILDADTAYTPVPYFWTDQFEAKIQVHGTSRRVWKCPLWTVCGRTTVRGRLPP
jgi:hypothetical protein